MFLRYNIYLNAKIENSKLKKFPFRWSSSIDYITDRISGAMQMPSLAQVIESKINEAYIAKYKQFFDIHEVNTT